MPKTLEEALAKLKEQTDLNTKLQTDAKAAADKATADLAKAQKTIGEKDAVIAQKNDDIVKQRQSYKKLDDMTKEEKAAMSDKEIELQQRQEKHESDLAKFQADQKAALKKEVDARIAREVSKYAGKDETLAQKIRDNYARINDAEKAQTDEEVGKIASEAFNMLGVPKPDAMRSVLGGSGGDTTGKESNTGFAETQQGKDMSKLMGLPEAPAPEPAK